MKWVNFGRSGNRERQLRTAAAGKHSKDVDDELRAHFKRSNGKKAPATSASSAARSTKRAPPPLVMASKHGVVGVERPPAEPARHFENNVAPCDGSTLPSTLHHDNREVSLERVVWVGDALCAADRIGGAPTEREAKTTGRSAQGGSGRKGRSSRDSADRPTKLEGGDEARHGDDDDDDASVTTALSAYRKLRGILHPGSKTRSRKQKKHDGKPRGSSSPNQLEKKKPKYRSNKPKAGPAQRQRDTDRSPATQGTSNSISPQRRVSWTGNDEKDKLPAPQSEEPSDSPLNNVIEPNEEMRPTSTYSTARSVATHESSTGRGPPSDYPSSACSRSAMEPHEAHRPQSVYSSMCGSTRYTGESSVPSIYPNQRTGVQVATKGPAANLSIAASDGEMSQVFDMPWLDDASDGKLNGLYSGPVLVIPHGEGTLVLDGNAEFKFRGRWANGELATPLINDDEPKKSSSGYRGGRSSSKKSKRRSSRVSMASDTSGLGSGQGDGRSSSEISDRTNSSADEGAGLKYALGEIARSPRDMVIHGSREEATRSASLLQKHDQAFLKRSNGLWTCAHLADRAYQPTNAPSTRNHWHTESEVDGASAELEESMLFVINQDGATKIVKRRHWGKFVRRVRTDASDDEEGRNDAEGGGTSPAPRAHRRSSV